MSIPIEDAIKLIRIHMELDHIGQFPHVKLGKALTMAIDALQEKAEREDPKPLTIDELRQMVGEPVYLEYKLWDHVYTEWTVLRSVETTQEGDYLECIGGKLYSIIGLERFSFLNIRQLARNYGDSWIAYRHKPKEET